MIKWHVFPAALSPRQAQAVRISIPLGNATMADYTDGRDGIFLALIWTCQPGRCSASAFETSGEGG